METTVFGEHYDSGAKGNVAVKIGGRTDHTMICAATNFRAKFPVVLEE